MKKNWMKLMLLAILPAAMLVSCDEDGDDDLPPSSMGEAKVMVVHASPDAPGVDLLVDDKKVNTSALNYPSNTGYLAVEAGERNIKVNAAGTQTSVINGMLTFTKDMNYSIFATGSLADDDIEPLVVEDDLAAPANGTAKVRFIHLSPDAPMVDIAATAATSTDEAILFDDVMFREATEFKEVPTGVYNLRVLVSDGGAEALKVANVSLVSGGIYTIYAKGFATPREGNANTLGAEIITNVSPK
ncbi:DUF4397 domain-containing protein [Pontibacter fetidus]|uniref:DUF4397 domain-containing protein n=1 Tax=Pontibacter fetidus TaxID=2700082 RepID=A0A6B2GYR6_9BACT|nr:DUF4397 domain-containing protein [Pontibacter fetidus]NDK56119.1 DUF4397 domain-containing protein [Pontibacter fetidus]